MASYLTEDGYVEYPPYAQISQDTIENCKMFADRRQILEQMPKGAVAAELGVQQGTFSRQILDVLRPRELHSTDINVTRFNMLGRFKKE